MPKTIIINAQVCNALNAISRRLRHELNNATFYNKDSHTLELTIKAHVTRSDGIRLDVQEIRRRPKNDNTHNQQTTDRRTEMPADNTATPLEGMWKDSHTPNNYRSRHYTFHLHQSHTIPRD